MLRDDGMKEKFCGDFGGLSPELGSSLDDLLPISDHLVWGLLGTWDTDTVNEMPVVREGGVPDTEEHA